jgi:molybdate/tungstate transport system permease protein
VLGLNGLKAISWAALIILSVPLLLLLVYGLAVFHSGQGLGSTVLASVALSLTSSAAAAVVDVALFTPVAYLLAREPNGLLETLSDIPASIPHPIVGIALLLLDSPLTPVGRVLNSVGLNFFDSFEGLVAALVIVSAPIYIRAMQSHFGSANIAPEIYAQSMGASRLVTLMKVVFPASGRGIGSAALTSMSRAMSEFGSVAIVAYYVLQPPFYAVEPASVLVYQYYGYYGPEVAVTAAAAMIVFSAPIMLGIRLLRGREAMHPLV